MFKLDSERAIEEEERALQLEPSTRRRVKEFRAYLISKRRIHGKLVDTRSSTFSARLLNQIVQSWEV